MLQWLVEKIEMHEINSRQEVLNEAVDSIVACVKKLL